METLTHKATLQSEGKHSIDIDIDIDIDIHTGSCLTHIFILSPSIYIYIYNIYNIYLYKYVKFLPSTLNLRMIDQQSKCCLLLLVILTAKHVSRKRKSQHTFLGLAWAMHDLLMKYEGF